MESFNIYVTIAAVSLSSWIVFMIIRSVLIWIRSRKLFRWVTGKIFKKKTMTSGDFKKSFTGQNKTYVQPSEITHSKIEEDPEPVNKYPTRKDFQLWEEYVMEQVRSGKNHLTLMDWFRERNGIKISDHVLNRDNENTFLISKKYI